MNFIKLEWVSEDKRNHFCRLSISLYQKCEMSCRICHIRRDSKWVSVPERAWFVLKCFDIVTVREEQDSLFLWFCQ